MEKGLPFCVLLPLLTRVLPSKCVLQAIRLGISKEVRCTLGSWLMLELPAVNVTLQWKVASLSASIGTLPKAFLQQL